MRLELTFELHKAELPLDNKSIWISYLKNALTMCNNGCFYEKYFGEAKAKDYSFSIILSKPEFLKQKIRLENSKVKMIFSALDEHRTGLIFFSAFIAQKNRKFILPDDNFMILKSISQLKENEIISNKVIFKTVTGGGIVIREHDESSNRDYYFTSNDEKFIAQAKLVLKNEAMQAGFSESLSDEINIMPIQSKKIVVKQYGIHVDVSVGLFLIEADTKILNYFYKAGIGSKHSMGYGLLDIVEQIA